MPIAGRLKHFISAWHNITSDAWVLDTVAHCHIEFDRVPVQTRPPKPPRYSMSELHIIDMEVQSLIGKGAIVPATPCREQSLSNIFVRPKKDGSMRPIINLRNLNRFVTYRHFKMETLEFALTLLRPNCFLASIDLKDAYFTIPIAPNHQKYLRFLWRDKLWQFTCLCFGLTSAPRIFTKVMKPVAATLRNMGHISANYIDDSLLIGDTASECEKNVADRCSLLNRLGFVINQTKSHCCPTRKIEFLGFVINSADMSVRLPARKTSALIDACTSLVTRANPTILLVSQVLGKLVSCFPAVPLGPLYYRSLEMNKENALKSNGRNFNAKMSLTRDAKSELQWWIQNLPSAYRQITPRVADFEMFTDASLEGWGASCPSINLQSSGRWNLNEITHHINYLELLAAFFALKSFANYVANKTVSLNMDNASAVAYINHMGGCHSAELNNLTRQIWLWCIQHNAWLLARHIPGAQNTQADYLSRSFNDHLEWQLNTSWFRTVVKKLNVMPSTDLFASRHNYQLQPFVSWGPDPEAKAFDAFSISWANEIIYA